MGAWTIAKREIKSIFTSPVTYVVLGVYGLFLGIEFLNRMRDFDMALQNAKIQAQLMKNPEALNGININSMLIIALIYYGFLLFMVLVPTISMRLISDERAKSTYELLMTSPVSAWDIVLGKFMAGLVFILVAIGMNAIFVSLMFYYGNPEFGPVLAGYIGLFLVGAAFLSIGTFVSSLVKHYFAALIITVFIIVFFFMLSRFAGQVPGNFGEFLKESTMITHFVNFAKGIISTTSVVYFVSICVLFLTAAKISVQSLTRG